jgi:hypothetical protein
MFTQSKYKRIRKQNGKRVEGAESEGSVELSTRDAMTTKEEDVWTLLILPEVVYM